MFLDTSTILSSYKLFGTPQYLYSADILQKSYKILRASLPDDVDIFYSIKANPNIAICAEFRKMNAGAEVCSYYEIEAALRSKYLPKNIIFVGPAKSRIEIEKCLEVGVYAIVCES